MNGAPANPISGVSPSSASSRAIASVTGATCSGCSAGSRCTSASVRTGSASTGPVPGTMSTPTPAAYSGTTMSENRMAASTPCRRTGCRVISQANSGVRQAASMAVSARSARYSGRDRPAWRMNQTGSRDGVPPRAATSSGAASSARRGPSAVGPGCSVMTNSVSHDRIVDRRSTGASCGRGGDADLESTLVPDPTAPPAQFQQAVASLRAVRPRPELLFSALDAPPRLAPYTWAFGLEADAGRPGEDLDEPDTSGRLILLHDPDGQAVWEGTFRLVCFVQARLEPEQLGDELLPVVGWSWLTESLDDRGAQYVALGRHRHPNEVGAFRGHRRSEACRRRGAACLVDAGRDRFDAARGSVLWTGRGRRRTASGGRARAGQSTLIRVLTCVFDAGCDQPPPPVGWIVIDIAVTFTHRIPIRYRR